MQIECSICCELLTGSAAEDVRATSCGHIFHGSCLVDWMGRSRTCPQCRTVLHEDRGIRLFFQMNNHLVRLSDDEIQRGVELKATIKTAIHSMQKLFDEMDGISSAKTMAKDTARLASELLKKVVQDTSGADGTTTQMHLKNTSKKIDDALSHIAVFQDKMFVANKSLIDMAKQLNISGCSDGEEKKKFARSWMR